MTKNQIGNIYINFIEKHPYRLSILIGQGVAGEYRVLHANIIAMNFFAGEVSMPVTQFFGELWTTIEKQLTFLTDMQKNNFKINITNRKTTIPFTVEIQRQEASAPGEVLLIELQECVDMNKDGVLLRQLQHKYASVVDHNLDPIISIDLKLKIENANQAVHTALGYRLKELTGSSIFNLVKDENVERLALLIKRGFSGERIELEGIPFFHKKGAYLLTHLKTLPIFVDGIITGIHLIIRDISENHENSEKLQYLSNHDELTGLYNRKSLNEKFRETCKLALKNNNKLFVIHMGLDRFKLIIDALGHNGADEILKRVAERINRICPEGAKLYRNGGDEFIITYPNDSNKNVEMVAQNLLKEFANSFYYNHQEYFLSSSIGISVYPKDADTLEELLRKSGQALYFVKENGRSHYRYYEEEMNSVYLDVILMESHLRRAIELNELEVFYQPQVDLKTRSISSFEALLRWNNKKLGFVSPGQFIPIAEESGLIHSIGDWVLNRVCSQLKEWQDKQYRPVRIAVNISPQQFHKGNFAGSIQDKIKEYGIVSSSLEVEITESALTRMHTTLATLIELKKIGVLVSVDDFGTGYSSLSYLKQYPIDIIKIDRSFIQDIETDEKNEAIAKTIITLAHNLGMEVIAEGVEKDLQAKILLEAECQKAQGFLFSKAVPIEEINDKYFNQIIQRRN